MADEWKELFSEKKQKPYWKNTKTGESTWNNPRIASGTKMDSTVSSASGQAEVTNTEWVESYNEKLQMKVWKNTTTGKSTTKNPFAPKGATGAPASATPNDLGDWEEKFSKEKNKKYWKNKVTGKSSWDPPPSATPTETTVLDSSEWEEKFSKEKNKKYWKNKTTGKSSWNDPFQATKGAAGDATAAASDEWEEKATKEGRKYWKNKTTGKSTYVDPHKITKPAGDDASVVSALTVATSAQAGDWEEKFSKEKNKKYWKNKVTGKSTWTQPPELSAKPVATANASSAVSSEWEEKFSKEKNKKYWKNKVTGKSTWTMPADLPVVSDAAASSVTPVSASDEWEEKFSKEKNKKYWKNKVTGKSTWIDPHKDTSDGNSVVTSVTVATASHASEWEEKFSKEKNKKYWKNKVTGKSSWSPPPTVTTDAGGGAAATSVTADGATVESEWEEKFSKEKNKKYWKNKVTGKSTWTQPTSSVSPTSISATPSRAASIVQPKILRGVVSFAINSATEETHLTPPNRSALMRCLIQLRGKLASTELDILQFTEDVAKARRTGASLPAVTETSTKVLHTFKLAGLRSLVCNECAGQISIVLPAGARVEELPAVVPAAAPVMLSEAVGASVPVAPLEGSTPSEGVAAGAEGGTLAAAAFAPVLETKKLECFHLLLSFQNSSVAQRWFQAMLLRLDLSESSSTDQSAPVVSDRTNSDVMLSDASHEELLGAYNFASSDTVLLRMEAEWLLQSVAPSVEAQDLQAALSESLSPTSTSPALAPLPLSGLLLFKVLAVHESTEESTEANASAGLFSNMESSASQLKGWMSCWVRVDRAAKAIVLYDQGPGSAPSLSVNCEGATLHIPDLTDAELGCECNLYHCEVLNSHVKAKMSLAIKLPNAEELFKWSITFASLLENVTYCSGGVVNAATQAIDYLQEAPLPLPPTSSLPLKDFPGAKPFIAEICLGVLEGLAERRMCSSYLRNVRLNGAQIKSARFLQMNQRIVLLMKGNCASLTEGSVLLSVNGLSTVSTPASTILKFIADFPRQMLGELTLWKFPRMEFRVDVVMLAAASITSDSPKKAVGGVSGIKVNEKLFETLSLTSIDEAKLTPKSKLNKVLIQKRNSILKINNGQEMSFEGIAYPNILASVQSELLSSDNAAELSIPDISAVDPLSGSENHVNVTDKIPTAPSLSLADFTRTMSVSDINWRSTRFMVASGNISMLVRGDCGADVLLCRLQLSSCQLKLVYPAYGSSVDHLCIHLRDAKTQIVVRCPSVAVFIDLAECLLIALKMMGSFSADLAHLYDQSVLWKTTEGRVAAVGAKPARQSLLMQSVLENSAENASRSALVASLLSPVRTPMTPNNTMRSSADDEGEIVASSSSAPDTSILQAAEELEQTLSSLHLPLHFPTHAVVEKELVELFKLNNANHRLLAEFLTLQFEVTNPIPDTPETRETRKKSMTYVTPVIEDEKPVPAETKYPAMHAPAPSRDYESERAGSFERATEDSTTESAPPKDLDTVLRDKLMTSLLASSEVKKDDNNNDEESRTQAESTRANADEASGANAVEDASGEASSEFTVVPRVVSPPSPKETVSTVRRASIQMRSGSVLMGTSGLQVTSQPTASSTNRRATFRKSAITHSQEQAAVLLMSQIEKKFMLQSVLNKGDRAAISVLLNYLRNSPQDLVNIAVRFTSPTDVAGLAHFVVHRLCVYWSAEQRMLEETVFTAAQAEAPQHGRSFHDALQNSSNGNTAGATKSGLLFSSQSLLKRLSSTTHASGGSFLQALLNEITSRLDVVVFIQSLCEGISVESLTQDSGVADLCARVVEPFCRRFEAAVVSGAMPIILKHTLKALVRCEGSPIKPLDFIADSILPHILNAIVAKNKFAESLNRPTLTDEQVQVILDRVRDLVNLCFNQDVARHLKICLSDQAALSRSKWYIEKSLQYVSEDSQSTLGGREAKPSSIAKLAQIEMSSGKTSAMHGMVCVRPSELFFILQSMELSNISAAPLSAYSKELSQAITHMHTSDLLQRLHSELRLTPVPTSSSSSHASSTGVHRTGILDAMRESGVPALDREVTFLLHITPHSVFHTEFMVHFNDDSAATQVLPKGLPGLSNSSNSSNSNLAGEADLLAPLLTSAESVEESPEAHELASIRWLVQASRSALKAMYEHNNSSISKNQSVVRELQELRGKLLSRSEEIANILADWKKISICMEVCSNYKAQIGLLLEKYKHHKKLSQQNNHSAVYWNASGVSSTDGEGAVSTASLLDASATLASAAAQKDAEVQETLAKVVLLQLKLEGELQRIQYPAASQQSMSAKGKATHGGVKYYEQEGPSHTLARSASKLAALAASSPLAARIARGEHSNSGTFNKSPAWKASSNHTPQQRGEEYIPGAMRRAPNPLHVVMQSVFASSNPSTPNKL